MSLIREQCSKKRNAASTSGLVFPSLVDSVVRFIITIRFSIGFFRCEQLQGISEVHLHPNRKSCIRKDRSQYSSDPSAVEPGGAMMVEGGVHPDQLQVCVAPQLAHVHVESGDVRCKPSRLRPSHEQRPPPSRHALAKRVAELSR